jgi:hypothetical protein
MRVSPETEGAIHYLVNQRASTAVNNGRAPVRVLDIPSGHFDFRRLVVHRYGLHYYWIL